jgi:hypothetical protein
VGEEEEQESEDAYLQIQQIPNAESDEDSQGEDQCRAVVGKRKKDDEGITEARGGQCRFILWVQDPTKPNQPLKEMTKKDECTWEAAEWELQQVEYWQGKATASLPPS